MSLADFSYLRNPLRVVTAMWGGTAVSFCVTGAALSHLCFKLNLKEFRLMFAPLLVKVVIYFICIAVCLSCVLLLFLVIIVYTVIYKLFFKYSMCGYTALMRIVFEIFVMLSKSHVPFFFQALCIETQRHRIVYSATTD
jgi:hypothetical protein